MEQRQMDREFGELVATTKALVAKVDELSRDLKEAQVTSAAQAAKDYTYLDEKVDRVGQRVSELERIEADRKVAEATEHRGVFSKFREKFIETLTSLAAIVVLGFLVWLAVQYLAQKDISVDLKQATEHTGGK